MTAGGRLPRGVVALLLGDVVSSTSQWELDPHRMARAVEQMARVVDEVVRRHGGVRPTEQGEGDSFVAGFERASDAVLAALALRDDLESTGLQLRMGVHAGQVFVREGRNYAGPTINRAARLRDLGHGGQILVSRATIDLAGGELPADVHVRDLGTYQLRGLDTPEHVFQVDRGPTVDFPPLRSTVSRHRNLPAELTPFIGRHKELSALGGLVERHRLVTLVGSGGCGKTRLAMRFAEQHGHRWRDGTSFIDLSAATTASDVERSIAAGIGVVESPGLALLDLLAGALSSAELLLIFDNCEQVIKEAAVTTYALLRKAPAIRLVATSREPLSVDGEVLYRIPSLDVTDAVALFLDRARTTRQDFDVTANNASAVQEICERLDGIPLAIELAAARINLLSPEQIVAGLSDRFHLLTRGSRTTLPRQQTLLGSVNWSHDLLSEHERALLRRLSVFVGGFDLRAVELVCAFEPLESIRILDVLASLVDRSLVSVDTRATRPRYRLLETIRHFAADRLAEAGEVDATRQAHLDYFHAFAKDVWRMADRDQVAALAIINGDRENLYAALDWAMSCGRVDDALRLVGELWAFWASQGRFVEGLARIRRAVDGATKDSDVGALAAGLFALSWLEEMNGDYVMAYEHAEQGLTMARTAGDRRLEGRCLARVGLSLAGLDYEVGLPKLEEAIRIHRSTGDGLMLLLCLCQLGWFRVISDGPAAAWPLLREADQLAAERGELIVVAQAKACLAFAALGFGRLDAALEYAQDSRTSSASTGNAYYEAVAWWAIASVRFARGDIDGGWAASRAGDDVMPAGVNFATAAGYCYRAHAVLMRGDLHAAIAFGNTALEAATAFGPWMANMWRLQALAVIARALARLGDPVAAQAAIARGLEIVRRGQVVFGADVLIAVAAGQARTDGDPQGAESLVRDALALEARTGMFCAAADLLELLAALAADQRDDNSAVRLAGAAARHRLAAGVAGVWVEAIDPAALNGSRERLGTEAFAAAWSAGEALPIEQAVENVLRGRGRRRRPSTGWPSLTPAERRVVELAGEGLSNPEIGKRLFISRRTVDAHLAHIYAKLGISSRVELVAAAARRFPATADNAEK